MLFNSADILKIVEAIDVRTAEQIAYVLGKEFLSDEDIALLESHQVDINNLMVYYPPYLQAYIFGRMTISHDREQLKRYSYSDFLRDVDKMKYAPKPIERYMYNINANRAYSHIKAQASRIKEKVSDDIVSVDLSYSYKQRMKEEQDKADERLQNVVKEEINNKILQRKTAQEAVTRIGTTMGNWDRDYGKIVETECQTIYNLGQADMISESYGEDAMVYKQVYPGACRYCIKLFLTDGIGSKPRIFTLSELLANGSNIGRKQCDWLPTVDAIHPWCRCDLRYLPKEFKWNEYKNDFTLFGK